MIRWSTTAVVVLLAAVAAVVSYRHAFEVISAHGESGWVAYLVPLTIDGLIFAASMVLLDAARRGTPRPKLAYFTLALGILATLAANVMHGWEHGVIGSIVAAWPAVALVLSYELLMGLIRRSAVAVNHDEVTVTPDSPPGEQPAEAAARIEPPAVPEPVEYVPEPLPEELATKAANRFLADVITGEVPGVRTIKTELNIGQEKAQQVRAYLATLANA
ncbi:DUF2637 domain-containing protein [Nonomuraea wenchangensis]|uniref:DUF2637 domain-containing protein n=1 Tax=Nonomuraea wenchangensis TaxID=568860 RepID=UPI0033F29142